MWPDRYHLLSQMAAGAAERFAVDSTKVQQRQEEKLLQILLRNQSTLFGATFRFAQLNSIADFQAAVPLSRYEEYESDLEKGTSKYSLSATVKEYAWSSGTGSGRKKIPITDGLVEDFEAALLPWLSSLCIQYPEIMSGPAYWIIGPRANVPLPSGCSDFEDSQYFTTELAAALLPILSLPPSTKQCGGFTEWAFTTLLHLMLEPELSWISIWSPTILCELLASIAELRPLLIESLAEGHCLNTGLDLSPEVIAALNARIIERRPSVESVLGILKRADGAPWKYLWPNLRLCSCWTDGWAALFLPRLRAYLPWVTFQPKGLLATEAIVSIPFNHADAGDPVLCYTSHFFEFRAVHSGEMLLAHQLELGGTYEVFVTTNGGLYRYGLEDLITISGYYGAVPRFRFVGKCSNVSDLCGEKLHEAHVVKCLDTVSRRCRVDLAGAYLQPIIQTKSRYYELVIPPGRQLESNQVVMALDSELSTNPHYAQCRALRQLAPLQLTRLSSNKETRHATQKDFSLHAHPIYRDEMMHAGTYHEPQGRQDDR